MCGLVCAYTLKKAGIAVEVFEAAVRVPLSDLFVVVVDELNCRAARVWRGRRRSQRGPRPRPPWSAVGGANTFRALVTGVEAVPIRLGLRCSGSDIRYGTSHRAHLVIGADGIKSTVRKYVVDPLADDAEHNTNSKNKTNLAFSGSLAYRGLLPNSTVVAAGVKIDLTVQPVCFCGIDRINVVAFSSITRGDSAAGSLDELPHPWVQPVAKQELAETFQTRGWGADSDAIKLLNCMERPSRWSIHTVDPPLSSYVDPERGIALIGDAHVLGAYDSARRSRGNTVLEASARMGRITERYGKSGYSNEEMRTQLAGIWGPVWHHDLSEDVNKAVEMLREKRVFKEAESS
ncbi:FAD/NAD(P)-binding domain-containing protein [Salix suchowensis]|nr:FAD/NAD(P)-binding domain-containing protein [Salix suchowensis]